VAVLLGVAAQQLKEGLVSARASSRVWGSGAPLVSGRRMARKPTTAHAQILIWPESPPLRMRSTHINLARKPTTAHAHAQCTHINLATPAEPNPSVERYEENTKEIRSILRPSIFRLFLGQLVVWPKVKENTELLRILKEWSGPPFLFVSSFYLSPYLPMYCIYLRRYVVVLPPIS
jgi:hypothetical protein